MRRRRQGVAHTWTRVAMALGLAATATTTTSAVAPEPAAAVPQVCGQDGPVAAASLTGGVSTSDGCALAGRVVVGDGVAVRVPEPGGTSAASGLGEYGSHTLRVSNTDGTVRARTGDAARQSQARTRRPAAAPDIPPECLDRAHSTREDAVRGTFDWKYNHSTTPARLNPADALHAIRSGNDNLTDGRTDCRYFDGDPAAAGAYRGSTERTSNIYTANGYVLCGAGDQVNVVDWGDVGQFFAYTCWWTDGQTTTSADIRFGPTEPLHTELPEACSAPEPIDRPIAYDLQGAATHEWGHVYGLNHVTEADHSQLTMSPIFPNCSTQHRSLGLGDWLGMVTKYGLE